MLHQITGEMNKSERQSFSNVAILTGNTNIVYVGETLKRDLRS